MNKLEARLILQCRKSKSTTEVWKRIRIFMDDYSYQYIASKLRELTRLNYLIRKEVNAGRRGRIAYYTAAPQAVMKAMDHIESIMRGKLRKSSGVSGNNASLMGYAT